MDATWLKSMLFLLSPRICPVCGNGLNESDICLCIPCRTRLIYMKQAEGDEAKYSNTSKLFWGLLPIEKATSFMQYRHDSPSHQILVHIKYLHRPDIAVEMGKLMAQQLLAKGFFDGIDCIIPVPLHWTRQLHRGYNQSEQIARGVSQVTGLPVNTTAVKRSRANKTQTHLDKQEREKNVANIFIVKKIEQLKNKHILIIDDVMTTGSTIISCSNAIVEAEPTVAISILTLARASL